MRLRFVSFSYLSKVKSGGKVVHWTLTLSQDSCSCYESMHPTHLSSLEVSRGPVPETQGLGVRQCRIPRHFPMNGSGSGSTFICPVSCL